MSQVSESSVSVEFSRKFRELRVCAREQRLSQSSQCAVFVRGWMAAVACPASGPRALKWGLCYSAAAEETRIQWWSCWPEAFGK